MRNQMGPAEFPGHGDLNTAAARREINGPRPPLLKIHKDSRLIKKASSHRYPSSSSSSFSSNNSSSSCTSSLSNPNHIPADSSQHQPQPQGTGPVIIYTRSPKIIHTKARDFMALVQKLTGSSQSHHHDGREPDPAPDPPQPQKAQMDDNIPPDERDASSSVLSEGRQSSAVPVIHEANCISPILSHQNASISEIPLFTPNAADCFLSPGQRMYRYPYSAYMSPSAAHRMISPSISEYMNGMPEF
ncbi:VQ motif-containing protein 8, chloroplastic [Rhodamnia argentea]|uniref:VQ motif-containing protein 8, chloroplastic n=1 Tax=Rhodamnia argentea TaxID=178133 RepID=A0A8B8QAJ1_9MYRT|nr:VQ motif-containing protein 8, chloroplastic [Rhodamnia argentea]